MSTVTAERGECMKYLFINVLAGSASTGRLCAEKCRELMRQGHECLLAYGRGITGCEDIPTVKTFARNIAATGCRMAYCLDGGQTAAIVMGDQLINRPVYGQQRKISDIIYFATAMPEGG